MPLLLDPQMDLKGKQKPQLMVSKRLLQNKRELITSLRVLLLGRFEPSLFVFALGSSQSSRHC